MKRSKRWPRSQVAQSQNHLWWFGCRIFSVKICSCSFEVLKKVHYKNHISIISKLTLEEELRNIFMHFFGDEIVVGLSLEWGATQSMKNSFCGVFFRGYLATYPRHAQKRTVTIKTMIRLLLGGFLKCFFIFALNYRGK